VSFLLERQPKNKIQFLSAVIKTQLLNNNFKVKLANYFWLCDKLSFWGTFRIHRRVSVCLDEGKEDITDIAASTNRNARQNW